jgi:hypothetical protein
MDIIRIYRMPMRESSRKAANKIATNVSFNVKEVNFSTEVNTPYSIGTIIAGLCVLRSQTDKNISNNIPIQVNGTVYICLHKDLVYLHCRNDDHSAAWVKFALEVPPR